MTLVPALFAGGPRAAEGDPLIDRAVVADLGGFADHHADAVIDEQALADRGAGMDVDRGQHPPDMRDKAAEKIPAVPPQPISGAMEQQDLEAGIAKHHF